MLASRLGLSSQTVTMHESFLVRAGLVLRTEQGRSLSPEGIDYVRAADERPF